MTPRAGPGTLPARALPTIEAATRTLQDLGAALRLADLLDVLVVATFAYLVLTWFRQARSRVVMSGLGTLVGLYFLARLLDMELTLLLYQVGITVAAVALVVVFQDDIRRTVERVALTRPLSRLRTAPRAPATAEVLVSAAFELARTRTGALIVLRGREPLDRHLTGGVALGGLISEPLLYSIFDASSAGHDGALIVEDGLAARFAVHLPLSQAITGKERFGTRHAAALGLSERSDALVIVVSEERGAVSVAEGAQLDQGLEPSALAARLTRFLQRTSPERPAGLVRALVARDLGAKVLSLALAVVAWLVVHGYDSQTVARTYDVPVVLRQVPDELFVDAPTPEAIRVTLSGPERAIQQVDAETLALNIDGSGLKVGSTVRRLSPRDLNVPLTVIVHRLEPREVVLLAHATTEVDLPIKVKTVGKLAKGLVMSRVTARPASVRARIATQDRAKIRALDTLPVSLDGQAQSFTVKRELVVDDRSRLAAGQPEEVEVVVEIRPK